MNYNLRYYMTWLSERGEDCRIEILEKDFTGEAKLKKLGSAPLLRIDNADNGIIGTSLQFLLQADVDGELAELYTPDSKKFKVILYKNTVVAWVGYILQELYSEQYIAPPYDVSITATDQIALLKDVPYSAKGRMSLLSIIDNILKNTQITLPYIVQTSIRPSVMETEESFLSYVSVNDYAFADKTAYEALQEILITCNMSLFQQNGNWCIYRNNDVAGKTYEYTTSLTMANVKQRPEKIIGRMLENDVYPIGSLSLTKIAAKKNALFSFSPRQSQSILRDPSMITGDGWFWSLDYINAKPGKYDQDIVGAGWKKISTAYVYAFVLESTLDKTKNFALWQNCRVQAVDTPVNVKCSYLPLFSGRFVNFEASEQIVKLVMQLKLVADNGQTYYLNKGGWSTSDMQNIVFTGTMVSDSSASRRGDKSLYTTSGVEIPGFPADGILTISFRNDSRIRPTQLGGPSDTDENAVFRVYPRMAVTDVFITLPEITGYQTKVNIATNAAQNGGEYELAFADAYQIANEDLILYNFIQYGKTLNQSKWILQNYEFNTFYVAMLRDRCNSIGSVKNGFSGVIGGKNLLDIIYLEKYSNSKLRLCTGEYNLLTDELSGEWEQASEQMVDIVEDDTLSNNSSIVVVPGGTGSTTTPGGSGSGGNTSVNVDIESALAPIKDWFEVKDLADGSKVLFTKYSIASQGDQVANAVVSDGAIVAAESQPAQANIIDGEEMYNGSDMRYKWIEEKFRLNSATIAHAPLFKFKWKKDQDNRLKIGTSAQYWEEVLPELVNFDSVADFKRLNYQSLGVAIGISLAREIEWLKKQIDMQKKQIELLRTQIKGSNE